MSGYRTYQRYQSIEAQARMLGFRLGTPPSHWSAREDGDMVTLYPGDNDALPVFSRDAEIFTGTFGQVETFLTGWVRHQQYAAILGAADDKRIKRYEDRERARQAEQKKREEQAKLLKVLRASDAENTKPKK